MIEYGPDSIVDFDYVYEHKMCSVVFPTVHGLYTTVVFTVSLQNMYSFTKEHKIMSKNTASSGLLF